MKQSCLAIAALVSFDLWAGGYWYHNFSTPSMRQPATQSVANGSAAGSGVVYSFAASFDERRH